MVRQLRVYGLRRANVNAAWTRFASACIGGTARTWGTQLLLDAVQSRNGSSRGRDQEGDRDIKLSADSYETLITA